MASPQSVLIVEDDPASASYLETLLKSNGYTVAAVTDSGGGAVAAYTMLRPDIVLMDIMLKGSFSGCEAALRIKKRHCDAKVIFLTAHAAPEMLDYAVETEACGYLMKPYRGEEILATVRIMLSRQRAPSLKEGCTGVCIPLPNGYVYDMRAERLMGENGEVVLGKKALRLLGILLRNKNSSVSNEQLCIHVWGEAKNDCTLRSLVYRIRMRLGSGVIKNVSGRGYTIVTGG